MGISGWRGRGGGGEGVGKGGKRWEGVGRGGEGYVYSENTVANCEHETQTAHQQFTESSISYVFGIWYVQGVHI